MGRHIEESAQKILGGTRVLSVGQACSDAPAGWAWVKLTDVARLESGHTPSRSHPEYWDGSIPWISIPDAHEHHGRIIFRTEQCVTPAGIENSAARVLPAGTVCLSRTASVGYAVVMGCPMATSQDFVNWVCCEALEPRFLQLVFLAEGENLRRFGKGTTHTTIYFPEVLAFHICLPPMPEQRRIVAKLDALLARSRRTKEALDALPALIERCRQSVLAAAFRGDLTRDWREQNPDVEPAPKLRERIQIERRRRWEEAELERMRTKGKLPGNNEWKQRYRESPQIRANAIPSLPAGWAWMTLGDVAPLQAGYAFSASEFRSSGVRLLKGVNVRDGWISEDELDYWEPSDSDKYLPFRLREDDVVLAMDRPVYSSGTKATKVARLDARWHGALLLQRVGRFQPVPSIDVRYLWAYVRSNAFRSHLIAQQNGSQDGKDLPHVSAGVVDSALIPVPPMEEQRLICDYVEQSFARADSIRNQQANASSELESLDKSIFESAFRGELVLKDPADEPASVLLERVRAAKSLANEDEPGVRRRRPKTKVA